MILVYLYKASNDDELKYSLRSTRHFTEEVEEVWVVGDPPPADLEGVRWVPGGKPGANKFGTLFSDLLLACQGSDLPERFVLMNDDYHLLAPYEAAIEHSGPLEAKIASIRRPGQFPDMLLATLQWLRFKGYEAPLNHELHRPMPMVKALVREALECSAGRNDASPIGARTVYGAMAALEGVRVKDRKVYGERKHDAWRSLPIVSTSDAAWISSVGKWLRAQSPEPSRFEASR